MSEFTLEDFVTESNRIEGIMEVRPREVSAHHILLGLPKITIPDLVLFVASIQPRAILRDKMGLDVRVGGYIAPRGGRKILRGLQAILGAIDQPPRQPDKLTPWEAHTEYELLHPFTDGNGRSGRALWLWMMRGRAPLGFLHTFYYQTLESLR